MKGVIGLKVNFLEVIGFEKKEKINKYICKCDCGNIRNTSYNSLIKGLTKSCGCKNHLLIDTRGRTYNPIESSFRAKASNYKACAKQRNILFNLSVEETISLLKGNCNYCGSEPKNKYNVRNTRSEKNKFKSNEIISTFKLNDFDIFYNGIDRKNNNIGYTFENTVSCCTKCNTGKMEQSEKEFKEWITNIYNNYIKK